MGIPDGVVGAGTPSETLGSVPTPTGIPTERWVDIEPGKPVTVEVAPGRTVTFELRSGTPPTSPGPVAPPLPDHLRRMERLGLAVAVLQGVLLLMVAASALFSMATATSITAASVEVAP